MKLFKPFVIIAGIAILAMSAFHFITKPKVGDIAPNFNLLSLDGSRFELDKLKGSPVIIHFFATWCNVCMDELPKIVAIQDEFKKNGIEFLMISVDSAAQVSALNEIQKKYNISFPILLDQNGIVADSYYAFAVPETVFIDTNHKILKQVEGDLDWDIELIKKIFVSE